MICVCICIYIAWIKQEQYLFIITQEPIYDSCDFGRSRLRDLVCTREISRCSRNPRCQSKRIINWFFDKRLSVIARENNLLISLNLTGEDPKRKGISSLKIIKKVPQVK